MNAAGTWTALTRQRAPHSQQYQSHEPALDTWQPELVTMGKGDTEHRPLAIPERMLLAGLSNSTAGSVTNPIDVAKIRFVPPQHLAFRIPHLPPRSVHRLQLQGKGGTSTGPRYTGFFDCMLQVGRTEGLRGLFKGLVPCIARELSYSSIRLGLYEPTKELLGGTDPKKTPLLMKVSAGGITGSVGSFLTTPIDLVKVRLQADVSGKAWGGSVDTLRRVYLQEGGLAGLWQGWGPNTLRAGVLTAAQVPVYDHVKHTILDAGTMSEGLPLHMVCSTIAGFTSALATTPLDLVKTRLMNRGAAGAGAEYSGVVHCVQSIVAKEGPGALMKGFWPNWIRIAPHTTVSLIVFEALRSAAGAAPI